MPVTKMTYDGNGKGKGWVGEVHVTVILTKRIRGTTPQRRRQACFGKEMT